MPWVRRVDGALQGPVLAFDSDGSVLANFPDTRAGHMWAHSYVQNRGFTGHVEIFSPETRTSVVVNPQECRCVLWRSTNIRTLGCVPAERLGSNVSRRSVILSWRFWKHAMRNPRSSVRFGEPEFSALLDFPKRLDRRLH